MHNARVTEAYNLFFTRRKTGDIEYRGQRKDGTRIWIHDRILKVYEKDGELYSDGITWEINERKKTEKTLSDHLWNCDSRCPRFPFFSQKLRQ
jgi:PAS domain-containing protein